MFLFTPLVLLSFVVDEELLIQGENWDRPRTSCTQEGTLLHPPWGTNHEQEKYTFAIESIGF